MQNARGRSSSGTPQLPVRHATGSEEYKRMPRCHRRLQQTKIMQYASAAVVAAAQKFKSRFNSEKKSEGG